MPAQSHFHSWRIHLILLITALLFASSLLSACSLFEEEPERLSGASAIYTAAARTVEARATQIHRLPPTSGVTPAPPAANTRTPTVTFPAATVLPPQEPTALIPVVVRTAAPECDQARFVADVTIPDNARIKPGETFVKTWRLENSGDCTWTGEYSFFLESGDALGAPASLPLPQAVAPGEKVDLSVTFTAPQTVGAYRSDWKLRNADGATFGIGDQGKTFWVKVNVVNATGVVYDFVSQAASAEWVSGLGDVLKNPLDFGGEASASAGAARVEDQALLENGSVSSILLLTVPYRDSRGAVRGVFSPYLVQPGDRFKARLGFLTPDEDCHEGRVRFQLEALLDGQMQTLGEWEKDCDGDLIPVDLDLSALQGKEVRFVLTVRANGSERDNWAVWNSALIEN